MFKLNWIIKIAFSNIIRDFRYTLIGIIAIAFATMSILSMGSIARSIQDTILTDYAIYIGGNVSIYNSTVDNVLDEKDLSELQKWQAEGVFEKISPVIRFPFTFVKSSNTQLTNALEVFGIDSSTYPVVGEFKLSNGLDLNKVSLKDYEAFLTSDLAYKLGVGIGDEFTLVNNAVLNPITFKVKEIITYNTSKRGGSVFFNIETAKVITGSTQYTEILIGNLKISGEEILEKLNASNYIYTTSVNSGFERNQGSKDLFGYMLNGVGIIALFVGGIGIINTTRVSMRKRINEIGILKTLGYSRNTIHTLYMFELILISIIGSIIGIILGSFVAGFLIDILQKSGSLLITTRIDTDIIARTFFAGLFSTIAFGLISVFTSTTMLPMEIFRKQEQSNRRRVRNIPVYLVTLIILIFVAIIVTNDLIAGPMVIFGSLLFMGVLNLFLRLVLFLIIRVPIPLPVSIYLGKVNLRRNISSFAFPFLALIMGSITIGIVLIVNSSLVNRYAKNATNDTSSAYNIITYASVEKSDEMIDLFEKYSNDFSYNFIGNYKFENIIAFPGSGTELLGRPISNPGFEVDLQGEQFGSVENGVYLSNSFNRESFNERQNTFSDPTFLDRYTKRIGDKFSIITPEDEIELTVAGFYTYKNTAQIIGTYPNGFITDVETFKKITGNKDSAFTIVGKFNNSSEFSDLLEKEFGKDIFTITRTQYESLSLNLIESLAKLAVGIASLSFVAAVVLVINVVGLSMLERRKEIAVLKSVGYSLSQIRNILLLEFGFIGLLVGLISLILVPVIVELINRSTEGANLEITLGVFLLIPFLNIFLTFATVILTTWYDLRIRPLDVLRDE